MLLNHTNWTHSFGGLVLMILLHDRFFQRNALLILAALNNLADSASHIFLYPNIV